MRNKITMTSEQLINKANGTHCIEWSSITSLIDLASDEETKAILESIQKQKYHEEEFLNENL
jgi:hypothetical protein